MILNFKEIPQSHTGGGLQDSWELFCREFLLANGYQILEEPSRGADGGLDIKVQLDSRNPQPKWLVSCKHKAHSGASVTHTDEINIRDRVESNQCDGFIGFYSTLPSSGLLKVLEGLKSKLPYLLYDREKIERSIVGFHAQEKLFVRFFPDSYKKYKETYHFKEPVKLFLKHFEKEFDRYYNLYESLFHNVENIIPYLRRGLSFEDALLQQSIQLIAIPEIEQMHKWGYEFQYSGVSSNYSLKSFIYEMIPKEVKHIHNIDIYVKPNTVIFGLDVVYGFYAFYSNYIVCSPEFIKSNNEVFNLLAQELE